MESDEQERDDQDVSLTLKRSSWENLFRVITWCAPMATDEDVYRAQTGDYWTLANFWACIQHLQSQFKSPDPREDLTDDEKRLLAEWHKNYLAYRDPDNEGNSVEHLTGEECIEPRCEYPAGTAWSPRWCFACNVKRMDRVNESLEKLER